MGDVAPPGARSPGQQACHSTLSSVVGSTGRRARGSLNRCYLFFSLSLRAVSKEEKNIYYAYV